MARAPALTHAPARLAPHDIVSAGLCIGCGACVARPEAAGATMRWDRHGQLKPEGPAAWYRRPAEAFARICPFSPTATDEDALSRARLPDAPHRDVALGAFEQSWVGHVAEDGFRRDGSSGGLVTWVAAELMRRGEVDAVAHVVPATDPAPGGPFFGYRLSASVDEVREGAKSRYFPIELSEVIRHIRATPGRYAIVGVPCFIKAINLACADDPVLAERVTHLLGLFCGHMKSARLVESFAWQTGAAMADVRAVDYRIKDEGRPANWYRAHLTLAGGGTASQDWWHLADGDWGAGFFQNRACDFCDDVTAETADIAFGDAWVEPYSSDGRGTNVVIARSPAMRRLLDEARADGRLVLEPVGPEFVTGTQAAGIRHRREGLAYRLAWRSIRRRGVVPRKRVGPSAAGLSARRKLVYRWRWMIGRNSHRVFALARALRLPRLYTAWASGVLACYRALAWSHGPLGAWLDRIERRLSAPRDAS